MNRDRKKKVGSSHFPSEIQSVYNSEPWCLKSQSHKISILKQKIIKDYNLPFQLKWMLEQWIKSKEIQTNTIIEQENQVLTQGKLVDG